MVLLQLLVVAGPLRAQSGAPVDSLDQPVFGFLRPTYNSAYSVNRQQKNWQQDFSFSNKFSGVSVDNKTTYIIKTDPKRTNFKALSGNTASQLAFTVLNRIPLTASLSYLRTRMNDTNLRQSEDVLDTGLNGSYNLRLFRGARTAVTGGLGLQRTKNVNSYKGTDAGAIESGLTRDLNFTTTYNGPTAGMVFRVANTFNAVRTRPEAINSTDGGSTASTPRTNTKSNHTFGWTFNRWEPVTAQVDVMLSRGQSGYIIVSRDLAIANKEETASDENNSLSMNVGWKPKGSTSEAGLDFRTSTVLNRRAVEVERANDRSTTSFDGHLKHTLLGNTFSIRVENSNDDDRSPVRGNCSTLTRSVNANAERPWTPAFSTRALAEVRLRSQTYDDALQDNDALKTRLEGGFTWKPASRFSATITGNRTLDDGVSISPSQSQNSRLDENYGLSADVRYTLSKRTRLTQKYDFQELFTSYRFNATQDNLARSRNINTGISTELSRAISLDIRHGYEFRENGGYRRDARGTRYFAKGAVRYVQDLTATLNYRPALWLTFSTNERLYHTDDIQLLDPRPNVTSRVEFTQTASLSRNIPGGGTLKCDSTVFIQKLVRPVEGKAERFFSATLTVNKTF
jgi:hypothetical protein